MYTIKATRSQELVMQNNTRKSQEVKFPNASALLLQKFLFVLAVSKNSSVICKTEFQKASKFEI